MSNIFTRIKNNLLPLDTRYRVGMRVVKTAAAVMLCLLIAMLTKSNNIIQISCVSALVTLRSTTRDTVRIGGFRILGTVFGGIFGMLAVLIGLFLPYYADGLFVIVIPVIIVANLYVCNVFNMQDSCVISCVVTLIVASQVNLQATVDEAMWYTLLRIRDTLIGVTVASVINAVPLPRRRDDDDGDQDESDWDGGGLG